MDTAEDSIKRSGLREWLKKGLEPTPDEAGYKCLVCGDVFTPHVCDLEHMKYMHSEEAENQSTPDEVVAPTPTEPCSGK